MKGCGAITYPCLNFSDGAADDAVDEDMDYQLHPTEKMLFWQLIRNLILVWMMLIYTLG